MLRYKIDIDEIIDNNADVGGDDFDADEDFIWDKTLWKWVKFFINLFHELTNLFILNYYILSNFYHLFFYIFLILKNAKLIL